MKNKVLIFIAGLLVGAVITAGVGYAYIQKNGPMGRFQDGERPDFEGRMERRDGEEPPERPNGKFGGPEEKVEKETKANDVEAGVEVTENEIDLSNYDSNITITKAGEYTLTGSFKNSILIDADSDVTLTLKGVNVENKNTAAIANISKNTLTIELPEGSSNTLSDGGSSEYDACIYSNGALIINGSGTLNVYGKQQEGEGIATETNDITINGGKINIECEDDGINAGGDGGTITINDRRDLY